MLKAAKPEKNEKTAAISPIFADCQSALKITSDPNNVPDAIIVGIDISIDMFALSKRLKPSCLAPIIVIPERDDPGIKAIACHIPILQASIKSQSFFTLPCGDFWSTKYNKIPNKSIAQPIIRIDLIASLYPDNFSINPQIITGSVATISNRANFEPLLEKSPTNKRKNPKNASFTSCQKYKITAPSVPI